MAPALRLLAVLALVVVAACGSGTSPSADSLGAAPSESDALVLQVSRSGGFSMPGAAFSSVPSVSVYGDGRVVTRGPQIEIFPPPALPSVQVGKLDAERLRVLREEGRAVVEGEHDYGAPPVADAPTTVVVVGAGPDRQVASAVALQELGGELPPADGGGLSEQQRSARQELAAYVRQVESVASEVAAEPYDASAMAVLALPAGEPAPAGNPASVDGLAPEEQPWPGPALEPSATGASPCVVVTGEELAEVREAAASASTQTRWTAGGEVWLLAFRPLLPHESTCADVLQPPVPPTA